MCDCRRQPRFVPLSVPLHRGGASSLRNFWNRREYRGIRVDCDQLYLFPSFPFVSRSNFPPLRAKVNRTDTRTVTRNFLGKERSDRNEEGNRVGIFSFLPEAHSSHRRRDVVTSSIDLFPKPMLSRSSSRALVKFHDAWHIISRQGVGGKMGRRTASFPKRLGLMGGREESQFRLGPRCVSLYFLARTIDAFDLAPSYYLYHAFRYPPEK